MFHFVFIIASYDILLNNYYIFFSSIPSPLSVLGIYTSWNIPSSTVTDFLSEMPKP